MDRRTFLIATAASALVTSPARAAGFKDYTPGLIDTALANGETVFVDFSATWCSTCARQERVINAIRAEDPSYDAKMTFVKVDWDSFKSAPVTTSRGIPRRSTLLVLRGDEELGRLVAGTSKDQIKALMDKGL